MHDKYVTEWFGQDCRINKWDFTFTLVFGPNQDQDDWIELFKWGLKKCLFQVPGGRNRCLGLYADCRREQEVVAEQERYDGHSHHCRETTAGQL